MLKPDTIDDTIPSIYTNKPDTKDDEPLVVYGKPNTYEEEEVKDTKRLPQEVIDDLIVRAEFVNGKRPAIKTNDEEEEEKEGDGHAKSNTSSASSSSLTTTTMTTNTSALGAILTSSLLSHVPSSTTGLTSSPPSKLGISPSSSSSCNSFTSSATSRLALFQILKSKPMEDLVSYDLRKYSLTRPHEHIVSLKGTKKQVFHKVQPHSYSWGFQNILYKTTASNERIKIAEARRRAFNKNITVEWGDFPVMISSSEETFEEDEGDDNDNDTIKADTENTTKSNQLHNKTNSHLLFTYETEFEGYKLRWKRGSLLSHDMVCEVKFEQEAEKKRKWHVIAEFDSHRMGYLIHLGELIIDKNALRLVDRPDHFEAHIIVTCSTLIDLMRELVEKAVGFGKGGVVGSD